MEANPTTHVRFIVETVIGRSYEKMVNDKRKMGRRLKFYNLSVTVDEDQINMLTADLSKFNAAVKLVETIDNENTVTSLIVSF